MAVYYNEIDPYAAEWLRNLIAAGHIADGEVDTRSIEDVQPDDLRGFTQCHFFAGIGVWSHALRAAGWPDDRPVWTGSCPCQPFSTAGKGDGFADERHLWPAWHHLIGECAPDIVLGEQVASKDGLAWLDLVRADLEGSHYSFGAFDICAAGIGAPHIRQRLWIVAEWLGDTDNARLERQRRGHRSALGRVGTLRPVAATGEPLRMGDAGRDGDRQHARELPGDESQHEIRAAHGDHASVDAGTTRRLAHHHHQGRDRLAPARLHERRDGAGSGEPETRDADGAFGHDADGRGDPERMADNTARGRREFGGAMVARDVRHADGGSAQPHRPRPTHGYWRDADWLLCRDGKWRPVGPGSFPLANGAPARVGRLRAYGNAIVAPLAAEFVAAYLSVDPTAGLL